MTREKKTMSRPDDPRRALAALGRAVDGLAALVGGSDIVDAAGVLDGLMAFGPVAALGVVRIALDRARGNPALRARLVRLVGAIGLVEPKARRSAIALLCDTYQDAPNAAVVTELTIACAKLRPTQEELRDYLQDIARSIAIRKAAHSVTGDTSVLASDP